MSTGSDIGIGVGSAIGVIIFAALAFALSQPTMREALGRVFGNFSFAVTNFIPFAFITFGIIADVIGQEFRYIFVTITGFVAILVNWAAKFFLEPLFGVNSQLGGGDQGWCFIPGLESFESRATPMNVVSTTAIIVYLMIFGGTERQIGQNVALYVIMPLLLCVQLLAFYFGGCTPYYSSGLGGIATAMVIGTVVGATMYGIVQGAMPERSPFANSKNMASPMMQNSAKPPVGSPLGKPSTGGKCSAANTDDDNAYVCEAYKNGQLVTESIT